MHVYVIQSGQFGPLKIGITNDLARRQDELQVGNPEELYLIASYDCRSEKRAQHIEMQMHKLFKDYHIRGEWFHTLIRLKDADKDNGTNLAQQSKDFYRQRRECKL